VEKDGRAEATRKICHYVRGNNLRTGLNRWFSMREKMRQHRLASALHKRDRKGIDIVFKGSAEPQISFQPWRMARRTCEKKHVRVASAHQSPKDKKTRHP